jgi:hypothetical protein
MKFAKYLSIGVLFLFAALLAESAKHPDAAFLIGFFCWPACGLVYRLFPMKGGVK